MAVTASQAGRDIDWYVITDEADLTLRIANGLRMGEDRWGELTLNHPVSAHRWLEFTIEADGQLSCRPSRRDVVIEIEGEPQDQIVLQSGDPIELPHNRVHISDSFKRGPSDAPPAVVRCIEVDSDSDEPAPTMAQMVITESDLEPTTVTTSTSIDTAVTAATDAPKTPRPPNAMVDMMADKMADRIKAHTSVTVRASAPDDSIETALIPVDAESPFAASEVSDILRRPIEVSEQQDTRGAANSPVITPALTQIAPAERRSYTYLWALSAILGLGILAAIVTAISSVPDTPERPGNLGRVATTETSEAPTRTEELLTSVQNILSRNGTDDPAAWEFAVRSYEYILAQEPDNDLVRRRLSAARSRVAALRASDAAGASVPAGTPGVTPETAQSPAQPATRPADPSAQRPFVLETDVPPAIPGTAAPAIPGTATGSDGNVIGSNAADGAVTLPINATTNVQPLTQEQIASRLRLAAARLADGQIVAPRGSSASALILSVLAVDPTHREAINLLNASAEVMVARAEQAYANNNAFGARNTLEEVLAFHPRHGRANERWLEWTGTPSRYR